MRGESTQKQSKPVFLAIAAFFASFFGGPPKKEGMSNRIQMKVARSRLFATLNLQTSSE